MIDDWISSSCAKNFEVALISQVVSMMARSTEPTVLGMWSLTVYISLYGTGNKDLTEGAAWSISPALANLLILFEPAFVKTRASPSRKAF